MSCADIVGREIRLAPARFKTIFRVRGYISLVWYLYHNCGDARRRPEARPGHGISVPGRWCRFPRHSSGVAGKSDPGSRHRTGRIARFVAWNRNATALPILNLARLRRLRPQPEQRGRRQWPEGVRQGQASTRTVPPEAGRQSLRAVAGTGRNRNDGSRAGGPRTRRSFSLNRSVSFDPLQTPINHRKPPKAGTRSFRSLLRVDTRAVPPRRPGRDGGW